MSSIAEEFESGLPAALPLRLRAIYQPYLYMQILIAVLIALLLFLNLVLWKFDDRGVHRMRALEAAIDAQKAENAALEERNNALEAEVKSLKEGLDAIEERARDGMGMIRRGETFYYLLEDAPSPQKRSGNTPPSHE